VSIVNNSSSSFRQHTAIFKKTREFGLLSWSGDARAFCSISHLSFYSRISVSDVTIQFIHLLFVVKEYKKTWWHHL